MEYSLARVDKNQKIINTNRPIKGDFIKKMQDYYRVSLTYTSNALEGNTLTESETKVILEDGITIGGHPLKEIYEVTGHAKAYDYIWTLISSDNITEEDILNLHGLFYAQIDAENAGKYRSENVIISGSSYEVTSHEEIPSEMSSLVSWINNERSNYHPVVFAAELHRRFVYIHPFIDGNGRTARLLMNLALIQNGYIIIAIPPIVRSEYISALERAHDNPEIFIELIIDKEVEAQKDIIRLFHLNKDKDLGTR